MICMEKQELVYITGHQHPDTDSVVSAIAYALLKRAMGVKAVACRLGPLSNETKYVLNRFGYEEPMLLEDARKKLSELSIDSPSAISPDTTIYRTIEKLRKEDRGSFAVVDEDNKLIGYVSKSDIANMGMGDTAVSNDLLKHCTVEDIADTISGTILYNDPLYHLNGKVSIVAMSSGGVSNYEIKDRIVIIGDDSDAQWTLIEKGAGLLIVVWAKQVSDQVLEAARRHHCPIIISGHGTMNTSRYIFFAPKISLVMKKDPYALRADEFAEEAGRKMMTNRYRSYPVLDKENHLVGYAGRFHIMNAQNKKIILVDHNEFSQSVRAIEKAQILEVVDHHRISDFNTTQPVSFRNEIVGSTATIIATMFREKQVPIPENLAGMLLAAILSDTLIFQSPTTTKRDLETANILAALSDLDPEELGNEMFHAAIAGQKKSMKEQIVQDIKYYDIYGTSTMISQIMIGESEEYLKKDREIQMTLKRLAEQKGLDLIVAAFTSVTEEGSLFFAEGDKAAKVMENLYPKGNMHTLKHGVLSRKLQILPMVTKALEN